MVTFNPITTNDVNSFVEPSPRFEATNSSKTWRQTIEAVAEAVLSIFSSLYDGVATLVEKCSSLYSDDIEVKVVEAVPAEEEPTGPTGFDFYFDDCTSVFDEFLQSQSTQQALRDLKSNCLIYGLLVL